MWNQQLGVDPQPRTALVWGDKTVVWFAARLRKCRRRGGQARLRLHPPRVKSGNSSGALPFATEASLSAAGALQVAAS
jgi:hypothetical protein